MAASLPVRDPGPMARLRDLQADPDAHEEIFRLLCDGKTLRKIASEWKLPKAAFADWVLSEKPELLNRARAVQTDEFITELVPLLKDVTVENASAIKTRVDGFLKLAGKWDRTRYGEHIKVERTIDLNVDAGLLGHAADLLAKLSAPQPKVIEAEDVKVLPQEQGI